MSEKIIYTNSQVEQLKNETNVKIEQLENKIEKIKFITEAISVKDVRDSSGLKYAKLRLAYNIKARPSEFYVRGYAYPVIINENIDGQYNNKFYVIVPTNPNRIVELNDDDTITFSYISYI